MSVSVDEAIKICWTQQAKLTETSRQCRDILHSMKIHVNYSRETDGSDSVPVKDEDVPVKEQQEIELLEQVLKKAVKVRSGSKVPTNQGAELQEKKTAKHINTTNSLVPDSVRTTAKDSDKIKPKKSALFTELPGRPRQPGTARRGPPVHHTTRGKVPVPKPDPVQISSTDNQKKPSQSTADSKQLTKEKTIVKTTEDKQLKLRGDISLLKEREVLSPLFPVWQAHRTKKNSLWNKVLTRHSRPVPERARFRERLSSTFPEDWTYGQVSVPQAELDALTQFGLNLTHCHRATLQNQHLLSARGPGPDAASVKRQYESVLMLQGLERMMIRVIKDGEHLKKEWERNTGRPAFPVRRRSMWGDPVQSCLPPALSYSTESELEELNSLKFRVDQLQLEIRLHQQPESEREYSRACCFSLGRI